MRLLVTGGTGMFGSEALPVLAGRGHDLVVLSRRDHPEVPEGVSTVMGDLATGEGLEHALSGGVDAVIHASSNTKAMGRDDLEQTRHLLEALHTAPGSQPHVLYLSIVGVDAIPLGYYQKKLACEHAVATSGLPYTILRATQFDVILATLLGKLKRWPVAPLPLDFRFQPIAAADVAERAAELLHTPASGVVNIGGPQVATLGELARVWRAAQGGPRPVNVPVPGKTARAFREGRNTIPEAAVTGRTWSDYVHTAN